MPRDTLAKTQVVVVGPEARSLAVRVAVELASAGTIGVDVIERIDDAPERVNAVGAAATLLLPAAWPSLPEAVERLASPHTAPPVLVLECSDHEAAVAAVRDGAHDGLLVGATGPELVRAIRCAIARTVASGALRSQVVTDALTGLPNRLGLLDRLAHAVATARRRSLGAAVLFIDLDGFKAINDSLGHDIGDRVLQEIAKRLATRTRDSDTVARLGGDEFVVVMEHLDDARHATTMAAKILELVSVPVEIDEHSLEVSASIGISLCPDDGVDAAALLRNADAAMYAAKAEGKHGHRYYSSRMHQVARERALLEAALRQAAANGELELHYQPRWHVGQGRVSSCDALLRWRRPGLGIVAPAEFLALADDSGAILEMGRWVLRTACRDARRLRDTGFDVPVSVNLSARQLADRGLAHDIGRQLGEAGLAATSLQLEIPEGAIADLSPAVADVLADVHALGVRIAVDHFGAGCSSVASLKSTPVSILKIDGRLVRRITRYADGATMPRAIVALGRSLGLEVVAEGVETEGQVQRLRALGCDQLQGHFYGKPLPVNELVAYLRWACTAVVGTDGPLERAGSTTRRSKGRAARMSIVAPQSVPQPVAGSRPRPATTPFEQ